MRDASPEARDLAGEVEGDAAEQPTPYKSAPPESATTTLSTADTSDIADMGYEQARDELAGIVSTLESGRSPLEESMRLWERGEALAAHCQRWLDGAQTRIEEAVERREARTDA